VFLTGRITITAEEDRSLDESSMPGTLGRVAFAALALERQRVALDLLADRLWPRDPPADWTKSLAPLISKLRAALRVVADHDGLPLIEAWDGGYELHLPSRVWIDLEDGTRRLDRAEGALRHGDLRAAWLDAAPASSIFRRSFLTGFDAPWADAVRDRLVDRRHRTWMVLAEVWRRQADFALARTAATSAIDTDRWREDGHRLLIRIELDSGNRASARRAARRCTQILRDDLGVDPSEQTRALIDETGEPVG
jgi:DNA-binding SARP family transcriptional activator